MTTPQTPDAHAILEKVRTAPSDYVKVAVVDIDGVLRGKYLDKDKFLSATEERVRVLQRGVRVGLGRRVLRQRHLHGWRSGYPDAEVRIDLSTHRRIPWEDDRDFFLGDFVAADGAPLEVCPRRVLRR